ncbi:MAG TPA: long-chain fatty acid--CoA ligase [Thermoanaerobaculia bacterium]|nr:long-chain fatty acid--CoA ligase [Thermoanaerobaculia bacterium]
MKRFSSVVEMFHDRVKTSADAEAMSGRRGKEWYSLTWRQAGERARNIACGLHALGLEKSSRCAILSMTRPEWVLIDMGILGAAGATTTIYASNTPDECAYILRDSGAVCCFVENATQAAKLVAKKDEIPGVVRLIWIDGEPPADDPWMMKLSDLERQGAAWDKENPARYDAIAAGITLNDLATLIYTSGTTGQPKGVMLSHDNWVFEGEAIEAMDLLRSDDKQYLFLPLAHSFAKVLEIGFIRTGCATAVDGDLDTLVDNLAVVHPTVMAAVPRVFEKVYNKVVTGAKDAGGLKYKIFLWAVEVGRQVSALRQRREEPTGLLKLKFRLADKLVFSKLKNRFGGRIRYFVSGGAPLAREIAEFFHAADLLILEGYGLTESSAASFVNRVQSYKFGTVGPAVPGLEVKIADDGEILLRGRGIMKGYYNLPEATAESLDADGWLHTGDIGELDEESRLKITDRKKDIIVTAGGKNVAPQYVENLIKTAVPFVSQVVMLGDRRPFCIALVTINPETVGGWAKAHGIADTDYVALAGNSAVQDLLWGEIKKVNQRLATYEQIKKIAVLPRDFTQESGELTPKMSIKRKVVERNYADLIEGFYKDTMASL